MDKNELKNRTKKFSLDIIRLASELPETKAGHVLLNESDELTAIFTAAGNTACKNNSRTKSLS